eukprot:COSAG05_NODE_1429_length_4911_cov_3.075852_4_plen_121_part_00
MITSGYACVRLTRRMAADAKWCGPCLCLVQTYKGILFSNDTLLSESVEKEGKTIRFWKVCSDSVEGLEEYAGTAMPHILVSQYPLCAKLVSQATSDHQRRHRFISREISRPRSREPTRQS